MNYYQFDFHIASQQESDILLAFLQNHDAFDTFEETDRGMNAYMPTTFDIEEIELFVRATLHALPFDISYHINTIVSKNWNEIWEANFEPIRVGYFCGIRADFHPAFDPPVHHAITINPKMAFGTGHHATTYMMIQLMEQLDFRETKVLDYGCGTGILAILASKLGAQTIEAVDIEQQSYQNTIENAQINETDNIYAFEGNLNKILDTGFDVILANINRNVILNSLPTLYKKLAKGGYLLISGFILEDEVMMADVVIKQQFTIKNTLQKGDWVAMLLEK